MNSHSENSHVQILHYTSDDKHSIVLSHISYIATLNVKLYDFCEKPAGKRTNGRMSVRRLKQNILSIWFLLMIYDYLLADLKRPYPSHLDRTFGQKGNVLPFLGLQTPLPPPPPPPLRREWWKFAHERLQS